MSSSIDQLPGHTTHRPLVPADLRTDPSLHSLRGVHVCRGKVPTSILPDELIWRLNTYQSRPTTLVDSRLPMTSCVVQQASNACISFTVKGDLRSS